MDPEHIENPMFLPPGCPPTLMDIGPPKPSERPLRSTSVSKAVGGSTQGTMEFKSSFANNKFVGVTNQIPPRIMMHSFE